MFAVLDLKCLDSARKANEEGLDRRMMIVSVSWCVFF